MGFLQAIGRRIGLGPKELATEIKSLDDSATSAAGVGSVDANFMGWLMTQFQVSHERIEIHRDMHRMSRDDEIVKFSLDTIANRAMGYPDPTVNCFSVLLEPAKDFKPSDKQLADAQLVVNNLIERADLRRQAWQVTRRAAKYGNDFLEVLYEERDGVFLRVAGLKRLPEQTVWPNVDERGNRKPGYTQRAEYMPAGTRQVELEEYRMLHFEFGEEENYLGTSLFACARRNWNRLNLAEDATAAARLQCAFMKLVHRVAIDPNWPAEKKQEAINGYITKMTTRPLFNPNLLSYTRENDPTAVGTNLFIPDEGNGRGGIDVIDPKNAQLQDIGDILQFVRRLVTASTVPWRYFPFEGSVPKLSEGGGNSEDVNFACTLMMCHLMLQHEYNKLFQIELLLQGFDPRQFRITYRMAPLNNMDLFRAAQRDLTMAKALETLVKQVPGVRYHPDVIFKNYTSLPDAAINALMADEKVKNPEVLGAGDQGSGDGAGNNGSGKKTEIQLPGAGAGPEARIKV